MAMKAPVGCQAKRSCWAVLPLSSTAGNLTALSAHELSAVCAADGKTERARQFGRQAGRQRKSSRQKSRSTHGCFLRASTPPGGGRSLPHLPDAEAARAVGGGEELARGVEGQVPDRARVALARAVLRHVVRALRCAEKRNAVNQPTCGREGCGKGGVVKWVRFRRIHKHERGSTHLDHHCVFDVLRVDDADLLAVA